MKTNEFNFDLPVQLIAQQPGDERGRGRLMLLDRGSGKRTHSCVSRLPDILSDGCFLSPRGDKPLLVFNDTKVRKARLNGKSFKSGARTEFLLLEPLKNGKEEAGNIEWKFLVKHAARRKAGSAYVFYDSGGADIARAEIIDYQNEFKTLRFNKPLDDDFFDKYGHVPLPAYIKRADTPSDSERYQTVYAKQTGSAAAPTAGLHFTREILDNLKEHGVESAFITLHVGLGTFLPVRHENIEDHVMHEEHFNITDTNAAIIESAVTQKRKIIAVGTTSLRALESAAYNEERVLKRGWQQTSIFIYPGYRFKMADALFTNFHTPYSTLLMLVSAFAARNGTYSGKDLILESYKEAVREGYRFFSYGDAMLIY